MELAITIFITIGLLYCASIPFIWIWVLYHKIKCRKASQCSNRRCKYWSWCAHNQSEKLKDEIEYRKKIILDELN